MYIHEHPKWPNFTWDQAFLATPLAEIRYLQGCLLGRMREVGFSLREEASLQILTRDVMKTSEIEGEGLDLEGVRSSLARHLGLEGGGIEPAAQAIEGIVEVTLDAVRHHDAPLTKKRLWQWHAALFPTGLSGMRRVRAGRWRDDKSGPMEVVSGAVGRERVHFRAPSFELLDAEMKQFLDWFNGPLIIDPVMKAALAHFWFVTLHPFDDGNGRLARVIADMALARSEKSAQRFYSMSSQIRKERTAYYALLERTQKNPFAQNLLDITPWFEWFLGCLKRAILASDVLLEEVLFKAQFWKTHHDVPLNERQKGMLNRLLNGFEGKVTSSKWAKITKCSQDTALRDLTFLVTQSILVKDEGGGRSTSYQLNKKLKTVS